RFPSFGLLEGVVQQVEQCLAQTGGVSGDHLGHVRLDEADQLDLLLLGFCAEDAQAVFDQGVEVELHVIEFDLSRLQFREVENLVDQVEQLVAGAMDRSEEHTSELQSRENLVCRLLLEKKKRPASTTVYYANRTAA